MHPTYIQFASHLIYTKKLWIYGSTIRPPHTYKTHIHTYEKKRTYCEKHVTAFVFIHQMLTAAYCYQKKKN